MHGPCEHRRGIANMRAWTVIAMRPGLVLSLSVHAVLAAAALFWQGVSLPAGRPEAHGALMVFSLSAPVTPAMAPADPPAGGRSATEPRRAVSGQSVPSRVTAQITAPLPVAGASPILTASPATKPAVTAAALSVPEPRADVAALRDGYAAEVWRHLARFRPRGLRLKGQVLIRIDIAADGGLVAATLQRPSGSDRLDRLALDAAMRAAPYPVPPSALSPADRQFTIPFDFR